MIETGGMALEESGILRWPILKWSRTDVGLQNGSDSFKAGQTAFNIYIYNTLHIYKQEVLCRTILNRS